MAAVKGMTLADWRDEKDADQIAQDQANELDAKSVFDCLPDAAPKPKKPKSTPQ